MTGQRRERLRLLVRVLFGMAAAVAVFSVVGAIEIGSSANQIPGLDQIQQENRGTLALAALGGGLVGAGILAGLAGILTVLIDSAPQAPPQPASALETPVSPAASPAPRDETK